MKLNKIVNPLWLDRAISTHNYHCNKLEQDEQWTITHTAKALRRSTGGICEDLLIADWIRTYGNIERFQYMKDALAFIRARKKQLMREIHLD